MNHNQDIASAVRRALVLSAVAAATALPAHAQDQQSDESIQTVVVTGSNIRRTDEGALPVQVITQEQIQKTGATTAEQFLQTVSIAVQGNTNVVAASASGTSSGGVSTVSLRGLGSQRTLVLVNGKRVSGGGTITDSTSVDVNSIPLAAVQRVEVLKDGASAIYGSDAIAGVINFILRDDYQGAEATAYLGDSSDGGGGIMRANGVLGFGNLAENRYNVLFVASYQKEDALFGADRDFAASGINAGANNDTTSGNSFPANVASVPGDPDAFTGSINPLADNCAPSVESPLFGPGVCRYDPSPFVSLLPEAERLGVYSAATFALTDEVQLYGSLSFNKSEQDFVIQPVPISDQFTIPPNHPLFNVAPYNGASTVILQPSSPFYPTAAVQAVTGGGTPDLLVRYRSVITGDRSLTDTIEQPRGVLGVRGSAAGWDFDAGFVYSQTTLTEHVNNGYPSLLGILPLLNSGRVNFFGENTPDVQAEADAAQFRGDAYETETTISSLTGTVSRELFDLPAGALAVAFSGEFREEQFMVDPDPTIQTGDISGYGGNFLPIDVSRDVTAFSAELAIPIVTNLEAGLAVRYDDYEGTGNKTVPKASLRWAPVEQVMVRASWGKGFRAPSLTELYQPQLTGVTGNGQNDPQRCGVPDSNNNVNQDARDCATQFPIILGGNTELVPEESDNLTLGIVFEPTSNISIGLDAFKIKLDDTIIFGITPEEILANPTLDFLVTRGAPDPNTPGLPGHITNINQTNLNFGTTKVEGMDVDLRARFPASFGSFTLGLVGSYFSKYEIQNLDGSFRSINGKVSPIVNGNGGVVPRWHHYLSLGFNTGPWEAVLSQNFQTGYDDVAGTFEDATDPAYVPRHVSRYLNYDLQGAYTGIKNTRIALGVRNAFDQDPPYTNAGGQNFFQAGYDPGYADPRGRFFYGTVTYSFK
jgi:iron complex outermembrane recepter protein